VSKTCFLFLALLLASCAASIPYGTDYPLTNDIVHSRDGILSGNVPSGWFSSTEDTIGSALTILLMSEDVSATLTVKELKLDRLAAELVGDQGLKLLALLSGSFHEELPPGSTTEPKEFELRGKKFCSYEIANEKSRKRAVVFSAKGRYYECEAKAVPGTWSDEQYARTFSVQQSFLSSLTF
jgi:hypothetical protein